MYCNRSPDRDGNPTVYREVQYLFQHVYQKFENRCPKLLFPGTEV